jgi:hypothetical protein
MEIGICFASKSARLGQEGIIAEINYQCQGYGVRLSYIRLGVFKRAWSVRAVSKNEGLFLSKLRYDKRSRGLYEFFS